MTCHVQCTCDRPHKPSGKNTADALRHVTHSEKVSAKGSARQYAADPCQTTGHRNTRCHGSKNTKKRDGSASLEIPVRLEHGNAHTSRLHSHHHHRLRGPPDATEGQTKIGCAYMPTMLGAPNKAPPTRPFAALPITTQLGPVVAKLTHAKESKPPTAAQRVRLSRLLLLSAAINSEARVRGSFPPDASVALWPNQMGHAAATKKLLPSCCC